MRTLLAAAVLLTVLVSAPFAHAASGRLAPGVSVHGVPLGGSPLELAALVDRVDAVWQAEQVTVLDGTQTRALRRADLGVAIDVERTAAQATQVGREGSPLRRLSDFYTGLLRGHALPPALRVGEVRSSAVRAPDPGSIVLERGRVAVTRPRDGLVVDTDALARLAASRIEFPIPLRAVRPSSAFFALAYEQVNAALGGHVLVVDDVETHMGPEVVSPMLRIERHELGPIVSVDSEAVRAYVDRFAGYVDTSPGSARIGVGADGPLVTAAGSAGRVLDRELTAAHISESLLVPGARIRAAVRRIDASFSQAEAERWVAQAAVLGETTTSYDAWATRAQNISTAALALDGTVVAPGEEFSFWDRIGEVSYRTGYVDAGAIIGGASSTALAGGICQVSTTVFGAVYRTGVPILERQAHGYYIRRYELGLDAAVFDPGADLRWRNDLPDAVVLRAILDPGQVTFQVWGIPTGRTVAIDVREHSLYSVRPGQLADPAYPPGYIELGRTTEAVRTVREASGASRSDVIRSFYAPVWGGPAR